MIPSLNRGERVFTLHNQRLIMTKIKKIIITDQDVFRLKKHKSLRVDKYLIKVDDNFSIPQVKVYGEPEFRSI